LGRYGERAGYEIGCAASVMGVCREDWIDYTAFLSVCQAYLIPLLGGSVFLLRCPAPWIKTEADAGQATRIFLLRQTAPAFYQGFILFFRAE
jgi:hypothetical protein